VTRNQIYASYRSRNNALAFLNHSNLCDVFGLKKADAAGYLCSSFRQTAKRTHALTFLTVSFTGIASKNIPPSARLLAPYPSCLRWFFFLKELFMSNILIKLFLSNIREPQRQPIPRTQLSLLQAQINPPWYPPSHPIAQSQQSPQDPTSSPPHPSIPPTAFTPILPAPSRSL